MSFSSVQSQQFGNVQNYNLGGGASSTIGQVLYTNQDTGKYVYSLNLIVSCSGTTFTNSLVKVGQNLYDTGETITNVLKCDVTGKTTYYLNLAGIEQDDFQIYLYATTATINKPVTWSATLQLTKVV
jgi:hypothetical protein